MRLTPGARIGAYEITGSLGAGGMGEVYRATDTKLRREVAVKVLPAALAADPDRLADSSGKPRSSRLSITRTSPRSTASKKVRLKPDATYAPS